MGIIKEKIILKGVLGSYETRAMFDSGATFSFIRKDIAEKLDLITKFPNPRTFNTAKGGQSIEITERITLDFELENEVLWDEFLVTDQLNQDVIIGARTMQVWHLKLDFENDKVIVDHEAATLLLI